MRVLIPLGLFALGIRGTYFFNGEPWWKLAWCFSIAVVVVTAWFYLREVEETN